MQAVESDDREKVESFATEMLPRIIEYLKVTVRANDSHAKECAQESFSIVLERIANKNFNPEANVVAYLLVTARNEYFSLLKREYREGSAVFQEMFYVEAPEQLDLLVEEDKQRVLRECLNILDSRSKDLITYMFKRPDASFLKISNVFGISPLNVRTRKSRIINRLSDCVKRKLGD